MNTVDIKQHTAAIAESVAKLEAENDRLRTQAEGKWHVEAENSMLKREISELTKKLAECERQGQQARNDAWHWRKAVRYEQTLKRPPKIVRHLPIYNDILRAKRRDGTNWYGSRTNPERIFLKRWRKENKGVPGINGGRGILEIILSEDNGYTTDLSQRDATVAATVIQWLGTNCGYAFLHECEREIEESRKSERSQSMLKIGAR